MTRRASTILAAAVITGVALVTFSGARVAMREATKSSASSDDVPCGPGFFRRGSRCCPTVASPGAADSAELCAIGPPASCPPPLVVTPRGCDAPARSVALVPAASVVVGPSDWEAEGRVAPRTVVTGPFAIDRFEVSVGRLRCAACPVALAARLEGQDPGRAASTITLAEARVLCAARGGRLPTEDEWIIAAAGSEPRRYPWGDTGAVCRRAAWGLRRGPCGNGATGPDTVGAHPDGATPLGVQDMAGNVAEWVETGACKPGGDERERDGGCVAVVRGGSFETELATDLRTWARRELPASSRAPSVGVRCAYDGPIVRGRVEGGRLAPDAP